LSYNGGKVNGQPLHQKRIRHVQREKAGYQMGRIFISAGHGGYEGGKQDPGTIAGSTTEAREMILIRDLMVTDLRGRGFEVLSVPDDLSASQSIDWINGRGRSADVALEIHADAHANPSFRGAGIYYIANNSDRKRQLPPSPRRTRRQTRPPPPPRSPPATIRRATSTSTDRPTANRELSSAAMPIFPSIWWIASA